MTLIPRVVDDAARGRARRRRRLRRRHHPRPRPRAAQRDGRGAGLHPGRLARKRSPAGSSTRSTSARAEPRRPPADAELESTQESSWICSSIRASSCSRATASPCRRAASPTRSSEAVAAADAAGLSGRREGAGAGRRPRQGGRREARRERRRGAHPRGQHPRPRHQGPRRRPHLGRARVRHRRRVLRVVHARPRGEEPSRHALGARAASRSRPSPKRIPTRSRASTSTRSTASTKRRARAWVAAAKLDPAATEGAVDILLKLYRAYEDGDADLVEINPLILTPDGKVHALDAKVTLDDNARFRHPEWDELEGLEKLDPREREASEKGLQYVGLDGDVGVIANGAGLAMATCDIVHEVGGRPANFLDIGGGASAQVMANALGVINNDPIGEGDLHQHLRRHHQGRGSRQRHRAGVGRGRHLVADRDPARRHQRRDGPRDPEESRVRSARQQGQR